MDWSGRTVLVTGAGGFIGSHLTERLVEVGARVKALVRYTSTGSWGWLDESPMKAELEVVLGDVRDQESIRGAMEGVDTVFHLAALIGIPYSYRSASSYVRTNVEGTLNVLELARGEGVRRVIQTSTSEVYGSAQYTPMDEGHPLQGQSPYSASKIGADMLAMSFHRSHALPVGIVRPFNTFGPRQSARAVIPTIIAQALRGEEVRIGSLEPTRDFNYVSDTVSGFVLAAECEATVGEVVNLGSGKETSIEALARAILELMALDLPIRSEDRRKRPERSEVDRLCASAEKARSLMGWEPRYSLHEGLAETVAWMREHGDRYRPGVYAV